MKTSAALALFCVSYVAGAVGTTQKTAQLTNIVAAAAVEPIPVGTLPDMNVPTAVTSGSQTITTAASSNTNSVGATVSHGTTTQLIPGTRIHPGFSGDAYYNRYFAQDYAGYDTRVYPGFNGGASQSYLRWPYPGIRGSGYPGFFYATRQGFLRPLFPGRRGLSGGAYLKYLSGVFPGLFEGVYESLYGSRPFPSSYPVAGPGSSPAQLPVFPGGSATANTRTNTVSHSQVVAPGVGSSAIISGPLPRQTRVRLLGPLAE